MLTVSTCHPFCPVRAEADLVLGKFRDAEMMVTARIGLEDVPEKGFEALVKNKDAHVKILATPRKELLK